jgi:uncharacterized membrane protein
MLPSLRTPTTLFFLVTGLLTDKRGSCPTAPAFLGGLMLYQLYRFSYAYSIWLASLTVVDLVVVVFTYEEYPAVKRLSGAEADPKPHQRWILLAMRDKKHDAR